MIYLYSETKRRLYEIAKKSGYDLVIDVENHTELGPMYNGEISLTLYNLDHSMASKSIFSEKFFSSYKCFMDDVLLTELGKMIQKMNNKRDTNCIHGGFTMVDKYHGCSLKKTYEEWIKKNPNTDISTLYPTHMINYDIPPKLQYVEYPQYEAKAIKILKEFYDSKYKIIPLSQQKLKPQIKNVIFNNPATIVFWSDGTKTVVKTQDGETFDPEKGLAMAVSKKALGNNREYYHTFLHWLKKYEKDNVAAEQLRKGDIDKLTNNIYEIKFTPMSDAKKELVEIQQRLYEELGIKTDKKHTAVQKAYDLLVKYGPTEGDMILNEVIGYLGEALED